MHYVSLSVEEAAEVLQHYDLGAVRAVSLLKGGYANSNFRVDTDRTSVLLKVCHEKCDSELETQTHALEYFRKHGLRTAYALPRRDGTYLVPFRDTNVILFEFLHGTAPSTLSVPLLRTLGGQLAEVHRLDPVAGLPTFAMGIAGMRPFLQEIQGEELGSHPFVKRLWAAVRAAETLVAHPWPLAALHGDLFPDNTILIEGTNELVIVDWEEVCMGPAVLDLAMTALGCCFDGTTLQHDKLGALVAGYHAVRPLRTDERDAFADFLKYCIMSIAFWRFRQWNWRHTDMDDKRDSYVEIEQRLAACSRDALAPTLHEACPNALPPPEY